MTSHCGHTHDPSAGGPPHWNGVSLLAGGGATRFAADVACCFGAVDEEKEDDEDDEDDEEDEEDDGG